MFQLEIPEEIKILAAVSCIAGGILFFSAFYKLFAMPFWHRQIKEGWERILESTRDMQARRLED